MGELLERGAREYINHPRGVRVDDGRITMSSIYDWFSEDFESDGGALEHAADYASADVARDLRAYERRIRHDYDWSLNDAP